MTTVYYNFPAITLDLHGRGADNEIQISNAGQPLTNIQLNNVNYSAYSIIVASIPSSTTAPGHLIIKCYADINDTTSNLVYLAVPLKIDLQSDPKTKSDVDKIIDGSGIETVTLNLDNYINDKSDCVVSAINTFPVTITLESEIPIQQHANTNFYDFHKIRPSPSVDSSVKNNKNATTKHQDLDWIMSCELMTEDGPNANLQMDPGTTATTITLFMMVIMISCATYIAAPILYKGLGMFSIATNILDGNHYTINVYWGISLIMLALICFGKGLKSNNTIYYFIAVSLILSYFSATSAILQMKDVGNDGVFAKTDNPLAVYYEMFKGGNDPNSRLINLFGLPLLKIIVFSILCSPFVALCSLIFFDEQPLFALNIGLYILAAVLYLFLIFFTTSTPK